jgi:hypothetical protein
MLQVRSGKGTGNDYGRECGCARFTGTAFHSLSGRSKVGTQRRYDSADVRKGTGRFSSGRAQKGNEASLSDAENTGFRSGKSSQTQINLAAAAGAVCQ